jgi:hypothetical protein
MPPPPLSHDEALELEKKEIASQNEKSSELKPVRLRKEDRYDFDPEGWLVFCVVSEGTVGSAPHHAVNFTTGEYRYFGVIGE